MLIVGGRRHHSPPDPKSNSRIQRPPSGGLLFAVPELTHSVDIQLNSKRCCGRLPADAHSIDALRLRAIIRVTLARVRALCESGTRKILKPAISGNHSAASGDANVSTAAGTSPLISRSIAPACPSLNWISAAPAAKSAALKLPLDADCLSSIAMFLLFSSDNELISGTCQNKRHKIVRLAWRSGCCLVGITGLTGFSSGIVRFVGRLSPTVIAVTRSAISVASATCSCISALN